FRIINMDLDQLKSLWEAENSFQSSTGSAGRGAEEIRKMIRTKSRTYWRKIRRNTLIEMALVLLAMIGLVVFARTRNVFILPAEWQTLWLMGGLGLAFYVFKFFSLGQLPASDQAIESFLKQRIKRLKGYMRLYRFLIVGLVPLLGAAGVLYGFVRESVVYDGNWPDIPQATWFWVLSVMLAYAGLAAWGSTLYLKRLYGQHLAELERGLAELAES
ncbi:MAG: hypothetical protein AAFN10_17335, partial [Bacteroidota bacterium]